MSDRKTLADIMLARVLWLVDEDLFQSGMQHCRSEFLSESDSIQIAHLNNKLFCRVLDAARWQTNEHIVRIHL